jgi:hypothetical protein
MVTSGFYLHLPNHFFMSDKAKTAGLQQPAAPAAGSTRDVLNTMLEKFQFQNQVERISAGYGKRDALKALHDISTFCAQCQILTDQATEIGVDHFELLSDLYELIETFPEEEEFEAINTRHYAAQPTTVH